MKKFLQYVFVIFLAGFGLLTLFLSTSVIFDLFGIRAREGNYVLFIVWANFISSILYLFSAYGLLKNKKWTVFLLGTSAVILALALAGLLVHIHRGGLHETKTIYAMIFRTSVTVVLLFLSHKLINKNNTQ